MSFLKNIQTRGIPELDSFRLLAVTMVLGHHLFLDSNFFLNWLNLYGYVGVDLFFTLSGFIITLGLQREWNRNGKIDFKKFWYRRALRLWPSLAITLFISTALVYFFGLKNMEIMNNLKEKWWHYYFHFGNYSYVYYGKLHRLFGHFWSLAVEEHFYLIWPLLFTLVKKIKNSFFIVLPLLILVPYAFRVYYISQGHNDFFNTLQTHTRFDDLTFGCLLAFYWTKLPNYKKIWLDVLIWTLAIGTLQFGLELKLFKVDPIFSQSSNFFRSIATLIMIYALTKGPENGIRKFWKNKYLSKLGILSYGVYLTHFIGNTFLFKAIELLKLDINNMVIFAISNFLAYLMAYFLYLFIDTPFSRLKT